MIRSVLMELLFLMFETLETFMFFCKKRLHKRQKFTEQVNLRQR